MHANTHRCTHACTHAHNHLGGGEGAQYTLKLFASSRVHIDVWPLHWISLYGSLSSNSLGLDSMTAVTGDNAEKSTAVSTSEKRQGHWNKALHAKRPQKKKRKSLVKHPKRKRKGRAYRKVITKQSKAYSCSCAKCAETMARVGTIPFLGPFPEQPSFCRARDCFVNLQKKMGYLLLTVLTVSERGAWAAELLSEIFEIFVITNGMHS